MGLLINGVAYAAIFIIVASVISRLAGEFAWRSFLGLFLFIAADLYMVFALRVGEGVLWIAGELVGVAIFGGMALLGLRGSLWWIVAGWALHPLWDVGLHYLGPGRSFAPESYTIACLSFDLLVAAYIAISYGVGDYSGVAEEGLPNLWDHPSGWIGVDLMLDIVSEGPRNPLKATSRLYIPRTRGNR